ncbi:hypothetical protein ALC53_10171, partial [Atta colombica]
LSRILNLTININKCNLMRVGCRFEVPRKIMTKRAVINVLSMDNACFAWSSSYSHYTMILNLQNIEFPIRLKNVMKFEHGLLTSPLMYTVLKGRILQCEFQNLSEEDFKLLTQKRIFPYECIDCADKLQDAWVDNVLNFDMIAQDYVLEIDLEYPEHLHDEPVDLPFCPTLHVSRSSCNKDSSRIAIRTITMASRLELNTKFRTLAMNDFEKNLFKIMNNTVFGKTKESYMRHHINVKLLTQWDGRYGAEAMIAKPNFHSRYTDTDSLIYRIECDDVYEQMKRDIIGSMSDYSIENVYDIPFVNKKVPGLKMYTLRIDDKKDTKRVKSIKNNVIARMITFHKKGVIICAIDRILLSPKFHEHNLTFTRFWRMAILSSPFD